MFNKISFGLMLFLAINGQASVPTIGIIGGTASGKTTLAENLVKALSKSGKKACLVSLDRYQLLDSQISKKLYKEEFGQFNYDHPEVLDLAQAVKDIASLKNGSVAHLPPFWLNRTPQTPFESMGPCDYLIVEGLHAFYASALLDQYQLKLFVSLSKDERLNRRIRRDEKRRNYSKDITIRNFNAMAEPIFESLIRPKLSKADMLINGFDTDDSMIINQIIGRFMKCLDPKARL